MNNPLVNKSTGEISLRLTLLLASIVFFVIVALLWALLNFFPSFTGGITAKESALTDLGNTIVVFSFVALALQSSLGVFVSNFRATGRNSLNRQVANLQEEIDDIKALINPSVVPVPEDQPLVAVPTSTSAPNQSPEKASQTPNVAVVPNVVVTLDSEEVARQEEKLKILRQQLEDVEENLETYRSNTRNIISLLSLLAGIVISLAGVRILQTFADVALEGKQLSLFNAIDVLLTGGLLAGGSAGVHRLTKVYEQVTDVSNKVKQK